MFPLPGLTHAHTEFEGPVTHTESLNLHILSHPTVHEVMIRSLADSTAANSPLPIILKGAWGIYNLKFKEKNVCCLVAWVWREGDGIWLLYVPPKDNK